MDLEELDDLFDEELEEILEFVEYERRPYTVKERRETSIILRKIINVSGLLVIVFSPSLGIRSTSRKLTLNETPRKALGKCQTESGATSADLETIKARKVPKTKTGRCFMDCIFNSAKILNDGKFNKDGMVLAFTPALKGDLTKIGKLRELSEVCEKEIGTKKYDNCEGGSKVVECVAKHGSAYGLSFSTKRM
ncbi:hypothetical protein JTB14_013144 [Gonioctena quinquepunctata]|nr:hypothetical protein JTB14_013144 [Gonioctena quinquepunctata]